MKKQIILTILSLALILTFIGGASAIANFCGDGVCTTYPTAYSEADTMSDMYCPADCGILTTSDWCKEQYNLINIADTSRCPICSSSSGYAIACDISRISSSDLNNWCASHNSPIVINSSSSSNYYWLIFLVVGFVIGYYYKKNKR